MKELDLRDIIATKKPLLAARLPSCVVTATERYLHLPEINELLREGERLSPSAFLGRILERLDITYRTFGLDAIPQSSRLMFASNHPFGGTDGIMLADAVCRRWGDVRLSVNDLLMNLRPLTPIFLPVNKFGVQGGDSANRIKKVFEGNTPIVVFPAGICSRREKGCVTDTAWHSGFIKRAVAARRDIVPVYCEGTLSNRFYNVSAFRKKLGIRYNVEMLMLPDELFRRRGSCFRIYFGKPIGWQLLEPLSPSAQTSAVRKEVERLKSKTLETLYDFADIKRHKMNA